MEDPRVTRLQSYHRRHYGLVLWALLLGLAAFAYWASEYRIDEVARASGEGIASSRVQVIQSVDGGVLATLKVREGDRVQPGDVLAQLETTRIGAAVQEVAARLAAMKAKASRLRAEVTGARTLRFPEAVDAYPELAEVEQALFSQRRTGLAEELRTLQVAWQLAREEAELITTLSQSGDANQAEIIRAKRAINEAEARMVNRKNQFLEEARIELTRVEDEIAQNEQIFNQRQQQLKDSTFTAQLPGIVKNIRITTVGGVLRAGEELMQIIPVDDELLLEAKVRPADIARVRPGLTATLRFDPFDYTIYGSVTGEVIYVSADTLKEESGRGEEIYYRAHLKIGSTPVTTVTGRTLEILPGMTAQVDIRTGDRTVMDYLLKPLRKTLSESFGER
ncbi:MAG: HlyD family efflux transporter periplasmic adaptor subunit [Gammaproteobacteria bacterium]|nr:HlyD family efflux transporter periplasmic adaptor subunit [Gammaproteobacteria bacterium]